MQSVDIVASTADFVVRQAIASDASAICTLYNYYVENSSASFALTPELVSERQTWLDDHLKKDMPVLVVLDGEQVIAFGSISPYHSRCGYAKTAELSIYIADGFTGRGLGKILLDKLILLATGRYHALMALICSENSASVKLFASRDFEVAGLLKQVGYKFGRYLDVTIMERLLTESSQKSC